MHVAAVAAKRAGLRVCLTMPGGSELDETHDTEVCGNCGGLGLLCLQTFVGGPFREVPANNPAGGEHIGFHNGRWWKMTLKSYACPACRREIIL